MTHGSLSIIASAGALTFAVTVCAAQSTTTPVEAELEAVYSEIDAAIGSRNVEVLDRRLTTGLTYIHAAGGVDSKPVFLQRVSTGTALQRQQADDTKEFDIAWQVYGPHTAVRRSRARFRFVKTNREVWMLQSRVFVKQYAAWQMAVAHGTRIHEGPIVDAQTYQHLAGDYHPASGPPLILRWHGGGIVAQWPDNGTMSQIFPVSAKEFDDGLRRLRFTIDAEGHAMSVVRLQGVAEIWRGARKSQ